MEFKIPLTQTDILLKKGFINVCVIMLYNFDGLLYT